MRITFCYIFFLITQILISQTTSELENKKKEINIEILRIEENERIEINTLKQKIDSINVVLAFNKLKEQAIVSKIGKRGFLFNEPNKTAMRLAKTEFRDEILVIGYLVEAKYYKVIYNNQVGYVPYKYIKPNKELIDLRKNTIRAKKYYSSSYNSNSRTRRSTSRVYYRGPRGGCYYINSNGNKTYVSRSLCN